jgi:hypothetical protein
MIFDWHVSIGTIIEVLSIFIGGMFFLWSMKARVDMMAAEVASLKTEVGKLADILTKLALQDQRIVAIEKDIDELRHGIGWIVKPPL